MFSVSRIHYSWYGRQESYLLVTIETIGAVPKLWGHWLKQEKKKKGKLMNDPVMEQVMVGAEQSNQLKSGDQTTVEVKVLDSEVKEENKEDRS